MRMRMLHAANQIACMHADAHERESKVWAQYLHVMLLGKRELKTTQFVFQAMDLTYIV